MTNTAITEKTTLGAMTDIAITKPPITEKTTTDAITYAITDNPSTDAVNNPARPTTREKTNLFAPPACHGIP
jgi:hypothetical protein